MFAEAENAQVVSANPPFFIYTQVLFQQKLASQKTCRLSKRFLRSSKWSPIVRLSDGVRW